MSRSELLNDVRETLISAGFYVSDIYTMRPTGFDLVARRDNILLIIKVLTNINALSEEVAGELKTLSTLLRGHPILIGRQTCIGFLEDDVVYDRFGIQAITPETLKHHLLEGLPLRVYAAPGGFYVNLYKERLVKLRQQHQLSLGSFARSIRVSRRTVQMYEEGMSARVDIALRMEDILGDALIRPIDILQGGTEQEIHETNKAFTPSKEEKNTFQDEIFSLLQQMGYTIIPMGRCPFEAVSKNQEKILLTCVQRYDKRLVKKARIVSSISKITEKRAVLFTDKKGTKNNIEGTPLIVRRELRTLRGPEEILELIVERVNS